MATGKSVLELETALEKAREDLRNVERLVLERAEALAQARDLRKTAQEVEARLEAALSKHLGEVKKGLEDVAQSLSPEPPTPAPVEDGEPDVLETVDMPPGPVFKDGKPRDHVRAIRPEDRPARGWRAFIPWL